MGHVSSSKEVLPSPEDALSSFTVSRVGRLARECKGAIARDLGTLIDAWHMVAVEGLDRRRFRVRRSDD